MWSLAISLLLVSGVLMEDLEDICASNPYRSCGFPESGVPQNEQELNDVCPAILGYYDCLQNYEETCGDKPDATNVFMKGEYQSVRSLIVDICTEGTFLHATVFENFNCIKDRILNRSTECHNESQKMSDAYKDLQNKVENQVEEEFIRLRGMCMYFFSDLGCLLSHTSDKCGTSVMDTMLEIINRSYFLRTQCSINTVREVQNSVESMDITESEKAVLTTSIRILSWEESYQN